MNILKSKLVVLTLGLVTLTGMLSSCDDDTNGIGINVMPDADLTNTSQAIFYAASQSLRVDSLVANTSQCYLGRVTDPETGSTTACNFSAQFFSLENYKLPAWSSILKDTDGKVACDSMSLNMFINTYYGDSLNSMKIAIMELDSANVMEEGKTYYTNFNPDKYLNKRADALYKESSFAVVDLEESDSIRSLSDYTRHISVKLPSSYGKKILNKYYDHPEFFRNSYTFIRNVLPGFYVKCISGNGTLVNIDVSTVNIYFKYTQDDSTYTAIERMAATEEVLQNNTIENKGVDELMANKECTYLKTPAGIFTEVTLPVDSIFEGHESDSINSTKIVFKRMNNEKLSKYSLETASDLLMLPKSEINSFFEDKKLADGTKEFISTFSSSYNSYTYENIGTLVQWMYNKMKDGAGITSSDNTATKTAKKKAWIAQNPDWNKIILVPVETETNSSGSYTKIYNEFGMTSTKLVGGDNNPIQVSVVYSKFNK